jgi:DNA replication protein DnaC
MAVNKMLIEAYLKKLKMPQAAKTYESLAREAADNNLDYEEYLLCVLEQEVHQRENNRIQRGIRQATFPVIKTLENFDFLAIPSLNKPRVLKLMQGEYIRKRENVILIGNSGVGKTHIAIGRCQVVVEFLLDNSPDVMQPNSVADHKTGSGSVLQY